MIRLAEASFAAWIVISSSMMFQSAGYPRLHEEDVGAADRLDVAAVRLAVGEGLHELEPRRLDFGARRFAAQARRASGRRTPSAFLRRGIARTTVVSFFTIGTTSKAGSGCSIVPLSTPTSLTVCLGEKPTSALSGRRP